MQLDAILATGLALFYSDLARLNLKTPVPREAGEPYSQLYILGQATGSC